MERASSQVPAANLGAGGQRVAFGAHARDKWWWAGAYLTGPNVGCDHSLRAPYAAIGRLVFVYRCRYLPVRRRGALSRRQPAAPSAVSMLKANISTTASYSSEVPASFRGCYAQVGYILNGEKRKYLKLDGAFGGVNRATPSSEMWQAASAPGRSRRATAMSI
jgi:phosphate-selective porin OprO/OprP